MIVADYVPAVGGTTTQTRMHAREFARRGWDVTILTRRIDWKHARDTVDGIAVRHLGPPGRGRLVKLPAILAIWWWLVRRRRRITAVSVIMEPDFALSATLAGLGSSTSLTWVTDGDATRTLSASKGVVRRRLLRHTPQIVLTDRMRSELEANGLLGAHVIPVPVDVNRFRRPSGTERAAARRNLGVDVHPVIVFVGHLQERKGVDQLLVAVKQLVDSGTDVTLLLVGGPVEAEDGRYAAALHAYVSRYQLDDRVRFLGPHADVVPYFHAADLFCLPSRREGMPNVLLEAMACGLPCVAPRDAGGDVVLRNGAGEITPSNRADELAAALGSLLSSPVRCKAIAATAVARVWSEHRIEAIVDSYEAVLAGGQPGPAPTGERTATDKPLVATAVDT
jgi:glycosyltransferase involved in cell wall biosynthesis